MPATSFRTIGGGAGTVSFMVCMSNETGGDFSAKDSGGKRKLSFQPEASPRFPNKAFAPAMPQPNLLAVCGVEVLNGDRRLSWTTETARTRVENAYFRRIAIQYANSFK